MLCVKFIIYLFLATSILNAEYRRQISYKVWWNELNLSFSQILFFLSIQNTYSMENIEHDVVGGGWKIKYKTIKNRRRYIRMIVYAYLYIYKHIYKTIYASSVQLKFFPFSRTNNKSHHHSSGSSSTTQNWFKIYKLYKYNILMLLECENICGIMQFMTSKRMVSTHIHTHTSNKANRIYKHVFGMRVGMPLTLFVVKWRLFSWNWTELIKTTTTAKKTHIYTTIAHQSSVQEPIVSNCFEKSITDIHVVWTFSMKIPFHTEYVCRRASVCVLVYSF